MIEFVVFLVPTICRLFFFCNLTFGFVCVWFACCVCYAFVVKIRYFWFLFWNVWSFYFSVFFYKLQCLLFHVSTTHKFLYFFVCFYVLLFYFTLLYSLFLLISSSCFYFVFNVFSCVFSFIILKICTFKQYVYCN